MLLLRVLINMSDKSSAPCFSHFFSFFFLVKGGGGFGSGLMHSVSDVQSNKDCYVHYVYFLFCLLPIVRVMCYVFCVLCYERYGVVQVPENRQRPNPL